MLDLAGRDVCDRLDATMRVPGKPGEVILRNVISKIIEQ
jgi:hypothetical protein